MDSTAYLFIGIILIIGIAAFSYFCLRFCSPSHERSVLYSKNVTHRHSQSSQSSMRSHVPNPDRRSQPYIAPYLPQPPPIGFGFLSTLQITANQPPYPTELTRLSSVESTSACVPESVLVINENRRSVNFSVPPYPLRSNSLTTFIYPQPPPTYEEAIQNKNVR